MRSGSGLQCSPASNGASTTATTIWTTSTTGNTRMAERDWSAVISLSSPTPAASAVAANQTSAIHQPPEDTLSARNLVLKPVQA